MKRKTYPPTKDRRDIGEVVFPIEKMNAMRELHSCCVGVEAGLETDSGFTALLRKLSRPARSKRSG